MTWTEGNAHKNLRRYRAGNILSSMDFTRGLFLVHILNMGGTSAQTGILQALFFWSTFLFEIPTGIFADRFKRKYSVLLGLFLFGLAFLIFAFAQTFSLWVFVFVVWGLSVAFQSGATSALLYDGFKELGPHWLAKYTSESAMNRSWSAAALALSMVVGGLLYEVQIQTPFLLCVVTALLSLVAYGLISESNKSIQKEDIALSPRLAGIMKQALLYFFSNKRKNILYFIFGMALLEAWHTPTFILSQLYLKKLGLSELYISIFFVANILAASLGLRLMARAKWIDLPWHLLKKVIMISVIPCLIILVLMTQTQSLPILLLGITLLNLVPTCLFVFTDKYIQDNLDSDLRASLLSVQSFFNSCFIGGSFFAAGILSDKYHLSMPYYLFGGLGILSLVLVSFHKYGPLQLAENR
jgi:MFS family permease